MENTEASQVLRGGHSHCLRLPAFLFLRNSQGDFVEFHSESAAFTGRANRLFYATLDAVQDAFFEDKVFSGGSVLQLVINFDEYPSEIGGGIRASDGSLMLYRPPRFFSREGTSSPYVESFSIPSATDTYTCTFGDTFGDGLGADLNTGYSITNSIGGVLGQSSFATGSTDAITFTFDPNVVITASPTPGPTRSTGTLPPGSTYSPTEEGTLAPTATPGNPSMGGPSATTTVPVVISFVITVLAILSWM